MDYRYDGCFPSTMEDARQFLNHIVNELNIAIQNEELCQDARLIISELVVNGTLHGNGCNQSKRVFVRLHIDKDRVWIQVEDEGRGIAPKVLAKDSLKTTGRGLHIVKCLSDRCSIRQNQITVEIDR